MTTTTCEETAVARALATAFRDVIETMFGLSIEGPLRPAGNAELTVAGMVGLAGPDFRGMLQVACGQAVASRLAAALLGGDDVVADEPNLVADSLGELANMLGGSVKRQLDVSGSGIELSLPSVLEGEANLHGVGATDGVALEWRVEGFPIVTTLVYSETE